MTETDVKEFIQTVADTQIKKDLIVFFHQNPCMDDARGLSVWVNQKPEAIAAEIDDLVLAGILRKDGEGPSAIYSYDPAEEVTEVVAEFVRFYKSERDTVQSELAKLQEQVDRVRRESLLEIQRERSKTKTIIASMADGVIVTDSEDTVVLYNPVAAALMGWDDRSALGQPLRDCLKEESLLPLLDKLAEIHEHPQTILSTELTLIQPRPLTLKANLSSVTGAEGERIGAVAVLRDVTEFKELDRMKNGFISMVSHELRSPLTAIKGFLLSILRGLYGEVADKQKEPLFIIQEQSDRLLNLINDLLEISRTDIMQIEQRLEPVQIASIMDRCANLIRAQAQDKSITVSREIPEDLPLIDADPENMEKVISNLLSNSVKYTPAGGSISVTAKDLGTHLQISVSDTGMGIPPESLPHIFEKFYRVKDEKTREIMGTGLGLSIVKSIVDAHMGAIEVQSEVDKGSCFTVTLPKRQAMARK